MTIRIALAYSVDCGADPRKRPRMLLNLKLPSDQVESLPLRATHDGLPASVETMVRFSGDADIDLNYYNGRGDWLAFGRKVPLSFTVGLGAVKILRRPFINSREPFRPMSFGSIEVHWRQLNPTIEFRHAIRLCWPTHDVNEIHAFRFEPSGVYLVGDVTQGLLPTPGQRWALRVAQPAPVRDEKTGKALLPRRVQDGYTWLLTEEPFEHAGEQLVNSVSFLEQVRSRFRVFRSASGSTMLDNIEYTPSAPPRVSLTRVHRHPQHGELIEFIANATGARLVIGGPSAGETQFLPDFVSGSVVRRGDRWRHLVSQFAAETRAPVEQVVELSQFSAAENGKPDSAFTYPAEQITSLNVPGSRTIAPSVEQTGEEEAESSPSDTVERSWLCLKNGWLGLDSQSTTARIAPGQAVAGKMGLLRIAELLHDLGAADATGRFRLELLPVAQAVAGDEKILKRHASVEIRTEKFGDTTREVLALRIEKPLTLLTTPRVWFEDDSDQSRGNLAVVDRADSNASLTEFVRRRDWVPSLATRFEATGAEEPNQDLAADGTPPANLRGRLRDVERTLWRILSDGEWVSTFATDSIAAEGANTGTTPRTLTATVSFVEDPQQASRGFRFEFNVQPETAVFWKRPENLPLVRTFPLLADQIPTLLLDDTRNLIPFHTAGEVGLGVRFPAKGLPELEYAEFDLLNASWDRWRFTRLGGEQFMLPTLPGLECIVGLDGVSWRMRHAVPVLDESYREMSEALEADTQSQIDADVDLTRIASAVAFEVGDEGTTVAATWLHDFAKDAAKAIVMGSFSPAGLRPTLEITLADGASVIFSRSESVAGLTHALEVSVDGSTADELPDFDVAFTTAPAVEERTIRRDGQPLLSLDDANHSVTTVDGRGITRHEPTTAVTRVRDARSAQQHLRLTQSLRDDTFGLSLDLVGIEVDSTWENPLDPRAQQWMLHDGHGDWPRLFGFAMRPVNLFLPSLDRAELTVELLPATPLERRPANTITHTIDLSMAIDDKALAAASASGMLKWSFEPAEAPGSESFHNATAQPALLQLQARIVELTDEGLSLKVEQLSFSGPTGLVRCTRLSVPAKIHCVDSLQGLRSVMEVEAFTVDFPSSGDRVGASVHVPAVSIPTETRQAVALPELTIAWDRSDNEKNGTSWQLRFSQRGWEFALLPAGAASPFEYALKATQLRRRQFVFQATAADPTSSAESFFTVDKATGLLSLALATSTHLDNLGGELLFQLGTRFNKPGQPADSVLARLSITNSAPALRLAATGSFCLDNAIRFETSAGSGVTHTVRCFLDVQTPTLPIAMLLFGKVPDREAGLDAVQVAVVLEHQLAFDAERTLVWQQPQWLRWTSWETFREMYKPAGAVVLPDDALILDASTVVALQPPGSAEATAPALIPDLVNGSANIALSLRQPRKLQLDHPICILRLPCASAAPEVVLHTLKIDPDGSGGVANTSGAQQASFDGDKIDADRRSDAVAFFQRAGRADQLRESVLHQRLRPVDGRPAVPAWPSAAGAGVTIELPDTLPDLSRALYSPSTSRGIDRLHAATLVRQYPVFDAQLDRWWEQNGQVLADTALLSPPALIVNLARVPAANEAVSPAADVPLQLMDVRGGQFRVLAADLLPADEASPEAIRAWATEKLRTKPRGVIALVLREFSEFVVIPPHFDDLRNDVPTGLRDPAPAASVAVDPRCRLPGRRNSQAKTAGPLSRLKAVADRTIFATAACVPDPGQRERPVVAATHFRLASVTAEKDTTGRLRPAQRHTAGLATLTQWDESVYQASSVAEAAALHILPFPDVDGSSLTNVLPPMLKVGSETITSPLVHVISWAARPGEVGTTCWGSETHSGADDENEATTTAVGLPTVATLRRPRAEAGTSESVRLIRNADSIVSVLNESFDELQFLLEQTLGVSPLPSAEGVMAALVTPETFFRSRETAAAAETEPALIYKRGVGSVEFALEQPLRVWLIAGIDFNPTERSTPNGPARIQSFLIVQKKGEPAPGPYPEDAEPNFTVQQVLIDGPLDRPQEPPWTLLSFETLKIRTREFEFSSRAQQLMISQAAAEIVMLRYQLIEGAGGTNVFEPIADDVAPAISVRVLDRDAAIRPPGMSVTLVSADPNVGTSARCAGYGRLESEDFAPPAPALTSADRLSWVRFATLRAVDRHVATNSTWEVVLYGAGGELIPYRDDQKVVARS